jgi:Glycosyltransferases involved in cell wall biogenesis
MNLEQKINYQLNKIPVVKKIVKRIYQRTMYLISPKLQSEGRITRISPNDSENEYFFGYYDKSPWDANDEYVLCLRAKNTWTDVSPREAADILLINTKLDENDMNRVRKIAETRTWNVQQGCMMQWLGPDFQSKIIYNDLRNGQYVSIILEIQTGNEQVIFAPVYTVSGDGKFALTLDFSRLYNLRPGYGYYNVPEKTEGIALPKQPCIWRVDLEDGEIIPILSYSDFANFKPRQEMQKEGTVHKVNHLMLSPDNKRFMVLYRWFNGSRKYTRLITCNVDGTDMYLLSDDDMVSHCFWKDNSKILAFESKKKGGPGYYLMKDKTEKYFHCWPQLENDGHPSYSPDGNYITTDSYPDRARIANIKLMDKDERNKEATIIAKVFAPFKYDNDTRCDLHPRWNRASNKICFDSVFEGHRGLYYVDIVDDIYPQTEEAIENKLLISVIVPVYNVKKYLNRCVNSIVRQTYTNLEIILIDDGSTDGSEDICDVCALKDKRIKVIHKSNGGLSSARNAGLDIAAGEFVSFIDSDDWIEIDTYEYLVKLIKRYNAEVADIECQYANSENDLVKDVKENVRIFRGKDVLWNYFDRGLKVQNNAPYTVWRKLYKRKVIGEKRFPEGKISEDLQFNYEVLKETNVIVLSNQVKYHYFQNNGGISIGPLNKSNLDLLDICENIYRKEKKNSYKNIKRLTKVKLARSYFSLLARIAKAGYVESDFDDIKKLTQKLTKGLRKNFVILMRSAIPVNRKWLICIFCVDYRLVAYPLQMIKCLKGSRV